MSERPSSGRGIAGAFRNRQGRERGGRRSEPAGARAQEPPEGARTPRRKGKKVGKRSDPSYTQVSALVMRDVKARFALAQAQASLDEGRDLEFGELVNMLMAHFAAGDVGVEELRASLDGMLGD